MIGPMIARYGAIIRWKLAKYFPTRTDSRCPVCGHPTNVVGENTRFLIVRCVSCGHATVARISPDEKLRIPTFWEYKMNPGCTGTLRSYLAREVSRNHPKLNG